jgi:hypothetical protein
VPFIAVCPYCQSGRVRAPESALGMTAPCPKCQNSFTLIDSGETYEQAQERSGHRSRPKIASKATAPIPKPLPVAESTPPPLETDEFTAVAEPTALSEPRLSVSELRVPLVEDSKVSDPVRAPTLIAFTLAGVGLILSQLPYGRFGTVGLAAIGLAIAATSWVAAQRPLLPAAATILNLAVLVVAFLLPSWLGLGSWRPKPVDKDAHTVRAYGNQGIENVAGEWIPADKGWQLDDIKVMIRNTSLGPIELTGPKGEKRLTKKQYLQVRVRVGNGGVKRLIEFKGWETNIVRMSDHAGRVLQPATTETGWEGPVRVEPASLPPGRAADQVFVFEAPASQVEYLRLELPGSAFGANEPVRFQIVASQIKSGPLQ